MKCRETHWNLLVLLSNSHAVVDQAGIVAEQGIPAIL